MELIVRALIICVVITSCSTIDKPIVLESSLVMTDTIENIVFYRPKFNSIEFWVDKTPSKSDTTILFCCTASFTKYRHLTYNPENVAGPYVAQSTGLAHGYDAGYSNKGAFLFYDDKWEITRDSIDSKLRRCAMKNGSAFTNLWIDLSQVIHNEEKETENKFYITCNERNEYQLRRLKHRYRALCERDDSLFIAESLNSCTYANFTSRLKKSGVKNAIYLDCGIGWSYGWYRTKPYKTENLHSIYVPYISNWIVFRK